MLFCLFFDILLLTSTKFGNCQLNNLFWIRTTATGNSEILKNSRWPSLCSYCNVYSIVLTEFQTFRVSESIRVFCSFKQRWMDYIHSIPFAFRNSQFVSDSSSQFRPISYLQNQSLFNLKPLRNCGVFVNCLVFLWNQILKILVLQSLSQILLDLTDF